MGKVLHKIIIPNLSVVIMVKIIIIFSFNVPQTHNTSKSAYLKKKLLL
jgi:hypothetical protein